MNGQVDIRPEAETVWVRTDDLSRHAESQIRAKADPQLVAEYAEAMLEGAEFPPVIIFQDADGYRHLADGHHRVDAAALAALKDTRRSAEVLAEIRPGTLDDALRYAMRANVQHGKRMSDADYARAIGIALDRDMIQATNAKDVVPELVALTGCSIRRAQECSAGYRKALILKRDRLIIEMHSKGKTQEAIGTKLGVDHATVSRVIDRFVQKRDAAEMHNPAQRSLPPSPFPEDDEAGEAAPDAEAAEADQDDDSVDEADQQETADDTDEETTAAAPAAPSYKIDVSPYLPLLAPLAPIDEGGDDLESGDVAALPDISPADAVKESKSAVRALGRVEREIDKMFKALDGKLDDLTEPYTEGSAAAAIEAIDRAFDYLGALRDYIEEGAADANAA
jgi:DNA-binding NarL/FixJ family response regulator